MAFKRIASQNASNTSTTTSVVATYPAPPTNGNLLIAVAWSDDFATTISGWTLGASSGFGAASKGCYIFYKTAGASEPTAVTASDAAATNMELAIYEYSGLNGAVVVDKTTTTNNGIGLSASLDMSALAPTTGGNVLLVAVAGWSGAATFVSWSTGFYPIGSNPLTNSTQGYVFMADRVVSESNSYGPIMTSSSTGAASAAIVAFKDSTPYVSSPGNFPDQFQVGNGMSRSDVN